MSRLMALAFASSLVVHTGLFTLLQRDLAPLPDRQPLRAKLVLPPKPQAGLDVPDNVPEPVSVPQPGRTIGGKRPPSRQPHSPPPVDPSPDSATPTLPATPVSPEKAERVERSVGVASLPVAARGAIRYLVMRGTQGMIIGRAEHEWEFGQGNYRLLATTETIGLAALVKPVRVELESRGRLMADGLRPQRFLTRKNGAETADTAEFDWQKNEVALSRNNVRQALAEGAQDLLSFHYQLAYLPKLTDGTTLQVATGRRVEAYRFRIVGEESLETEIGVFRTLRLKTQAGTTTELWLALDHGLLPVRIRHTDRRGDIYDQIVTEMGSPGEGNQVRSTTHRSGPGFQPPSGYIP